MVDANQSGCLFVGEGVILKGNFAVPDIASVSGVVEGDLSAKQVIVEASGLIGDENWMLFCEQLQMVANTQQSVA